ncbi:MAG: hypothetical protein EZS28_028967 [Streblomastix strix]|uniref:Uncharacterized protein n=1 Tax=Streblomastix strix TaxID=222440 RepID=A0A5J4UYP7_9EUKA|nr:MAG: hypothetical protein EZS28_028967 [Streblomastix strix]
MNWMHFIERDTDSAYWAIIGNPNEDFTQQSNAVVNDRNFYNENVKYFFPTIRGDVYDEKKILGLAIERQGVAKSLSPRLTPKKTTQVNIFAVLNKQVGRQAIKKQYFLNDKNQQRDALLFQIVMN